MSDPIALPSLKLRVTSRSVVAEDIIQFQLEDPDGADLPAFSAGAHIAVTTPGGQKRCYSLCNVPSERKRYVIAVKREAAGRGGSLSMAASLSEGDEIEVQPPHNAFPMGRGVPKSYIFIAGGIGITPIRSMILSLLSEGKTNFRLFYFARAPQMMAFREEFADPAFPGEVVLHNDGGDPEQAYDLWPVLEESHGAHLYCCGPKGLMTAVRDMTGHWPDGAVHFEDFAGVDAIKPDDKPFEVHLARSGRTFTVPHDRSLIDALRLEGVPCPSSCESGTCGTCRTRYLAGEPDHRDLVLTGAERTREIIVCVSRAKSASLTLDL